MSKASRLTAIAAIGTVVMLSFSLCCSVTTEMLPRPCCKGHCISLAASNSLIAIAPVKVLMPAAAVHPLGGAEHGGFVVLRGEAARTFFGPIGTVQLRI